MKNNILIELVISNQCNKRCKYCDLNFSNNFQTKESIDIFIRFLKNNLENNNFLINFFWWEPLLKFDLIKYFLKNTKNYSNINYSIWTNWLLLSEEKYEILKKYNVEIYFSIDTETYNHIFQKKFLLNYEKLKINFILNPNTIDFSFYIFEKLTDFWFKNFNIIPVYLTINWDLESLKKLKKFVDFSKKFKNLNLEYFSYYQKPTSDIQFILDTNLWFYKDIHTHLWFLKQFSNFSLELKNEIEEFSKITNLTENIEIKELLKHNNFSEIFKKSIIFPRKLWFEKNLKIIDKIIKW